MMGTSLGATQGAVDRRMDGRINELLLGSETEHWMVRPMVKR